MDKQKFVVLDTTQMDEIKPYNCRFPVFAARQFPKIFFHILRVW